MAYFPMFVDISGRPCLIVGGGRVAARKFGVLMDFGADITVVAEEICEDIRRQAAGYGRARLLTREYRKEDCTDMILVIAATDDEAINHRIALDARELGIPVNAVDQPPDCSFIFPSYLRQEDLVAAFSSGGSSPVMTQYLKNRENDILTPYLGHVNAYLGGIRKYVKERFPDISLRRKAYNEILKFSLEEGHVPGDGELEDILKNIMEGA